MQAKSVLALIWMLHEANHPYLSETDHMTIARYFLPTYLSADPFISSQRSFVKKPIFGREGDTVTVHDGQGNIMLRMNSIRFVIKRLFIKRIKNYRRTHFRKRRSRVYVWCLYFRRKTKCDWCTCGERITGNRSYFVPIGRQHEGGRNV